MVGKNQTSSSTKNQGGHRKRKGNKGARSKKGQKLASKTPAPARIKLNPNLGDITPAAARA